MTTNSTITPELLDQLLANYEKPEDLTGDDGLFKQLKRTLIERALGAELTEHLGYEKGDPTGRGKGNSRNGTSSKTLLTRGWRGRDCGAARSSWQFRAAADPQGADALRRFRREDSESLRPRHDGARDPGPPGRALRHRRLARPHQPGHRRGPRRGPGMAEPAARPSLSGGFLRRSAGQDS